ncbi:MULTISPECIES: hypothetical protein [unclassified Lysinibacillus]|uniref:hypothetical protein n=1 Tax=unclassified Lysinibacillus TaxID=2636778 RepID=UPI00200D7365|nr:MULTISPECIES: hypothetical protein [unclassified Lysinibacillus]MDD1502738.1 hypothetical protein [Lysinibacillus sp. CNPSo 3705]UPW84975.1 hypothetical protein MY533_09050 [Lysinibacillus sp. Ag94]
MEYEYKVKFYFDEGREEEYKIKNNIEQETFTEELSNGFNEKPWYSFTETEHYKTILISTKEVYQVVVEKNVLEFD